MKKSVKECLQEWKVPRHYVGYQYLLDAADLYAQGVPVGWPMLFQIGEKRGRAMFRVRKGLYTVVKYVRATPFGLAWQAAKGHPLQVGELLFYLLEPEGKGDRWGKGRQTQEE